MRREAPFIYLVVILGAGILFFYLRKKELSDGCHNLMQGVGKHTKAV